MRKLFFKVGDVIVDFNYNFNHAFYQIIKITKKTVVLRVCNSVAIAQNCYNHIYRNVCIPTSLTNKIKIIKKTKFIGYSLARFQTLPNCSCNKCIYPLFDDGLELERNFSSEVIALKVGDIALKDYDYSDSYYNEHLEYCKSQGYENIKIFQFVVVDANK